MAGNPENKGLLGTYERFNKVSRNVALGVAVAGAFFAPPLIVPALIWAGSDQAQLWAIDKYRNWKEKRSTQKIAKSGVVYKAV